MDEITSASLGARRNEDIALDLLKFVSVTAGVGRPAAPSTGFSGAAGPKPEEHVNQLLELYSRCLKAVEGQGTRDRRPRRPQAARRSRPARRKDGCRAVSQPSLRVAVAGAGAFGKNHLRVYRELEAAGLGVALVAAVEPDAARAAETAANYAIPVFATVDELLAADLKLDAATVAVPTVHHHAVASALLDAGLDLLVEKPLAATLAEADDLIAERREGQPHSATRPPGALQSRRAGHSAATAPPHVL